MGQSKAKKRYGAIRKLYVLSAIIQFVIIIMTSSLIFYSTYDLIKYSATETDFAAFSSDVFKLYDIVLLQYLPVIFTVFIWVSFLWISFAVILMPIIFNDLYKERKLTICKCSTVFSVFSYLFFIFFEKSDLKYTFVFSTNKVDMEFIVFLSLHIFLFIVLCVTSYKSKRLGATLN